MPASLTRYETLAPARAATLPPRRAAKNRRGLTLRLLMMGATRSGAGAGAAGGGGGGGGIAPGSPRAFLNSAAIAAWPWLFG